MSNDKSHAEAVWSGNGKQYREVARLEDAEGHLTEVQLSPESAPALRGWYNASELAEQSLSQRTNNDSNSDKKVKR